MGAEYASAVTFAAEGDGSAIKDWIGRTIEVEAPFPVEAGRVADFCSLVEDANPAYWDPGATGLNEPLLAPPGMLTVWRQPSPWNPFGRPKHGPALAPEVPLPADTLINAGLACQFAAPMRIGDRLKYLDRCLSVSGPKTTALGVGYFVRNDCTVLRQDGEKVGTYQTTQFRYRRRADAPHKSVGSDNKSKPDTGWAQAPNEMPDIAMPVSPTMIALLTAGTRDYFPGHHDEEYAKRQGAPGVYPNTNNYCGLVDRVATEWCGYRGVVIARDLKMRAQATIGATIHSRGVVVARRETEVDVEVKLVTDDALIASAAITLRVKSKI